MSVTFRDLVPVETARARLAPLAPGTDVERVALDDAAGRVLAEPVDAPIDVPGFDRAAMDGYAVLAEETVGAEPDDPNRLEVVGDLHPGSSPDVTVGPGRAARISTGAVIPERADAVVMIEDAEPGDGTVAIHRPVAPGENVMPRGDDVAAGERVLPRGRRLDPRHVGLLAALGVAEVPVARRPVVAVVSTGDEIRPVEASLGPGEIHDVNRHSLAAAIDAAGGRARFAGRVGDDRAAMAKILEEAAAGSDLVLTSGSTSASQVDVLYRVAAELGEMLFHGVDVKPGKPMFAAELDGTGVVGLPGYPVSAQMTFRLFVAPLIRRAVGLPDDPRRTVRTGRIAYPVRTRGGRPRQLPVGLVGTGDDLLVYPVDRGSGATTSLVDADGLVYVEGGVQRLDEGETVDVKLFTEEAPADVLAMGDHDPTVHALWDRVAADVKWLRVGAEEATRRADRGVPDVVVSNLDEDLDGHEAGVRWRRRLGVVSRDGLDLDDLDRRRVAGYRSGTGLAVRCRRLAGAAGVEPAWRGAFPTRDAAVRAVLEETVEAAIVAGSAPQELAFSPVGEETVTLWIRADRRTKPGVRAVQEAADGPWRDAVAGADGVEVV